MTAPGTHIRIPPTGAAPLAYRGPAFELWRGFCHVVMALGGWKNAGDWPAITRAVIVAAPHTSNWDGVWMLTTAAHYRIRLRYMGKKSLTEGPFGRLVRWSGCIPIDRSQRNDVVRAMADAFAAAKAEGTDLLLAIPPEGTREAVAHWKSGFYHIAVMAGVPLIMAVCDYRTRTLSVSGVLWPTGDYDADFPLIASHYAGATGKHPGQFVIAP